MNEPRTQIRIITALLVVVIALAGGLFFFLPDSSSQASGTLPPVTGEEPAVQHNKYREAEISLDPALTFTQTLGGSGDESFTDVYYENGRIYLFGNTASDDLDFEKSGAFLAILEGNGKIVETFTFEGELKAVTLYNGGYVMALDRGGKPVVSAINYEGSETNSFALPVVTDEQTLDIQYADDGYLVITALVQAKTGFTRLKMTKLSRSLEFVNSVVTDEVYSLGYIDTLDVMGEYRLVANALSDLKNMLCIGTWGQKLAHYPLEFSYTVRGFWITDDFYSLATTSDKTLLIGQNGSTLELTSASEYCAVSGDENYIYIATDETFFCVSNGKIVFSAEYGKTSFFADKYIYTVSENEKTVTVRSFVNGNKAFESAFDYVMTDARIFACGSGLFVIGSTTGKFGGTDLTLVRVDY